MVSQIYLRQTPCFLFLLCFFSLGHIWGEIGGRNPYCHFIPGSFQVSVLYYLFKVFLERVLGAMHGKGKGKAKHGREAELCLAPFDHLFCLWPVPDSPTHTTERTGLGPQELGT